MSIVQWRCRIGAFAGGIASYKLPNIKSGSRFRLQNKLQRILILAMVLVYANITQSLLVNAGVELNPGPKNGGKQHYVFIHLLFRYY